MATQKLKFDATAAKRAISERTKDFEKGLLESTNSFQQVLIFQKMLAVLTSEVDAWIADLAELDLDTSPEATEYKAQAEIHVEGIIDLVNKIKAFRESIIDDALNIQQAMINSHKLNGPIIKR